MVKRKRNQTHCHWSHGMFLKVFAVSGTVSRFSAMRRDTQFRVGRDILSSRNDFFSSASERVYRNCPPLPGPSCLSLIPLANMLGHLCQPPLFLKPFQGFLVITDLGLDVLLAILSVISIVAAEKTLEVPGVLVSASG
jgi:hypothetical protein